MYTIKVYTTKEGEIPFQEWLEAIKVKDKRAGAAVLARITRATLGNFGDSKPLVNAEGLWEMRIHYGGGYRVYYRVENHKIILILAGSTKKEQNKTIQKAIQYYGDYLINQNH